MFRKKDSESEAPAGTEGVFRRPGGSGAARSSSQPEIIRRQADSPAGSPVPPDAGLSGAPEAVTTGVAEGERPEANRYGGKRLIVGEGIRLSGEISSCDRLVVEGEVEVTLNNTLALEISSSGRFTGGCEVEEADISGVYEGDLTVRRRLVVRSSGKITGTIRYGDLELERGGKIAGNLSVIESGPAVAGAVPSSTGVGASTSVASPSTGVGASSERARSPVFSGGAGASEVAADKT